MTDYPERAKNITRRYVDILGMGFHPDTRGRNYIDGSGRPPFTKVEADQYDSDMEELSGLCDQYEIGIDEFRRRGWLPECATDADICEELRNEIKSSGGC